jgi:hypothetical protein
LFFNSPWASLNSSGRRWREGLYLQDPHNEPIAGPRFSNRRNMKLDSISLPLPRNLFGQSSNSSELPQLKIHDSMMHYFPKQFNTA